MHFVSSLLTNSAMLAVMLLHAGFGCCWHHDHAAHEGEKFVARTSTAETCGHHHHHEPASHEHGDPEPCPESEECHGDCVFVTGTSPALSGMDTARLDAVFLDIDATRLALRARVVADWNWSRVPPGDASPRALRPLLCVWQV